MTGAPTAEREAEIREFAALGRHNYVITLRAVRDLLALLDAERAKQPAQEAEGMVSVPVAKLERVYKALLSDPPNGPQKTILRDDVIYHLDGQLMYHAINDIREMLALARSGQAVRT